MADEGWADAGGYFYDIDVAAQRILQRGRDVADSYLALLDDLFPPKAKPPEGASADKAGVADVRDDLNKANKKAEAALDLSEGALQKATIRSAQFDLLRELDSARRIITALPPRRERTEQTKKWARIALALVLLGVAMVAAPLIIPPTTDVYQQAPLAGLLNDVGGALALGSAVALAVAIFESKEANEKDLADRSEASIKAAVQEHARYESQYYHLVAELRDERHLAAGLRRDPQPPATNSHTTWGNGEASERPLRAPQPTGGTH